MGAIPTLTYGFGGYIQTVPTIAALRATPSKIARSKGDTIMVAGTLQAGDGAGGVYTWMPLSTADDDGQQTIRPIDITQSQMGRWNWSIKAESAYFEQVKTLTAQYSDSTYGNLALKALIDQETTVRFDADQVTITQINDLEASVTGQFTATDAKITDQSTVQASATSALASRTTALEATVNDPVTGLIKANANITAESTARANADSALATRTTTLETTVNDPSTGLAKAQARITDESTARSNADSALASRASTLEAQFAGTSGSNILSQISNEATARANADTALSQQISQVSAQTDPGLGARVTTVENAVSTLDGKTAAYFQVTSVAGNNRAELSVYADANSGAGVDLTGDVHITGNTTIDGNVIVGGTVTTNAVANNAISTTGVVTQSGTLNGTNSAETVATYNLTTTATSTVFVIGTGHQGYANGVRAWNAAISISGIGNLCYVDGSAGFSDSVALSGAHQNLPAGTYTVTYEWSGTDSTQAFANGTLYIQAIYK